MKYASIRLVIFLALVSFTSIPAWAQTTEAEFINAGVAQSKAKDYRGANATYTACLQAIPKSVECLYRRAVIRQLGIGFGLALEDFNALDAMLPNNPQVLNARGGLYVSLKRYDDAIADLNRAIALKPDGEMYYERSNAYQGKGDADKQLADLTESIRLKPSSTAYLIRGGIYEKRKDEAKALADYNALVTVEPSYGHGYYRRGKIYFQQGKKDLAEADFAKAISLDPTQKTSIDALKTLAESARIMEEMKNRTQPSSGPDNQVASAKPRTLLEAVNAAGFDHANKKEWDMAITDFSKAIDLAPSDHWGYINRGHAYSGKGDYERALADINKGMSMLPKPSADSFRFDRAGIYLKQKNYEAALTELKAIMADEKEPNAYTLLLRGKVYAALHLPSMARLDFEQALKINKYLTEVNEELAKLDR